MFDPKSRYAGAPRYEVRDHRGRTVTVVVVPPRPAPAVLGYHVLKQGQQLDALLAALQSAQERRRTLEAQLARIDGGSLQRLSDPERLRPELLSRAADIRGVLARRDQETRRVLQAVFEERAVILPTRRNPPTTPPS